MKPNICRITDIGKRRDGGTKYWCLEHRADATAKYGTRAEHCRYSHVSALLADEILDLDMEEFSGGIALWGAVPPVYDTTQRPLDRGVHVHARRKVEHKKEIDRTFREVRIRRGKNSEIAVVGELDAIYFMVSSVFGFSTKLVRCSYCNAPHLDKDWFSVHSHQRHLCSACGKTFRDIEVAVGNPAASIAQHLGWKNQPSVSSSKTINILQKDYPGGIRIWGSNSAIVWSAKKPEESGIHVHAFKSSAIDADPVVDGTFSKVTIDGVPLSSKMVRFLMAQRALPHLAGRIVSIKCPSCQTDVFDQGISAYTPQTNHECGKCGISLSPPSRLRKVIRNPLVAVLEILSKTAIRSPQEHDLGLLPETL